MIENGLFPLVVFAATVTLAGCAQEPQVSYKSDVQPILGKRCVSCHTGDGDGVKASGFQMDTYANVMKGTKLGPMIVAGHSESSSLYRLVSGKVDKSIQMPHGQEKLTDSEVSTIQQWIDQGAKDN